LETFDLQEKPPEKIPLFKSRNLLFFLSGAILDFPNPNHIRIKTWIHNTDLEKKMYEEIFQFCVTGCSYKLGANDSSGAVL
jgi:hypothetical protein